jgi:hypothetical protein
MSPVLSGSTNHPDCHLLAFLQSAVASEGHRRAIIKLLQLMTKESAATLIPALTQGTTRRCRQRWGLPRPPQTTSLWACGPQTTPDQI